MLMLVYPFVFYVVNGIDKVFKSQGKKVAPTLRGLKWVKVSKGTVFVITLLTILFGTIFMSTPLIYDRFGVFSIPTTYNYVPSTMLYNTIPLRDVNGVVEALDWLNDHMNDHSVVLLQQSLVWWADLYFDKRHMIVYYQMDAEKALGVALKQGFNPVYMVWWNQNIGWYSITVPKSFIPIVNSDRISVFQFQST